MQYSRLIVWSCLLLCCLLPTEARQQVFTTYTANDGMVANSIRRIFQDSKGSMWIATWEGLTRYDGYSFTNFTRYNGLSDNLINDLYEEDNKLYIFSNGGFVHKYENGVISKAIYSNIVVNQLFTVKPGKVLAVTDENGLWEFKNHRLTKPKQAYPNSNYHSICLLNDSMYVAAAPATVQILDTNYQLITELPPLQPVECNQVFKDSKNRTWIASLGGLKMVDPNQQKNKPVSLLPLPKAFAIDALTKCPVYDICEDKQGNLWFGTGIALVKVDSLERAWLYTEKNGLPSADVRCIFRDRQENIWAGTALGIARLVTRNRIATFTTQNGLLRDRFGYLFQIDSTHLLLAAGDAIQVFDWRKRQPIAEAFVPASYPLFISNGHILINGPTLYKYQLINGAKSSVTPMLTVPYTLLAATRDQFHHLIVSDERVIYVLDSTGKQLDSLVLKFGNVFWVDKQNNIWIGTRNNGLHRIRCNATGIGRHDEFLKGKHIRSMFQDSKGDLWVGTRFEGAIRMHQIGPDQYSYQVFDQSSGLTSNWIRAIVEGKNGAIWLGFNQGVDKLVRLQDSFRVFNFSRINNYYANLNGMTTTPDSSIWIATVEGLTHIVDGKLEDQPPLPVYITAIRLADTTHLYSSRTLQLNYLQNQLQFEFTTPDYINEKQVLYSYRLTGSHRANWSEPKILHTVSYASLPAGTYLFEVRSMGLNGAWGKPAQYRFTIHPPFWATWWFRTIAFLVIAAVIFWLVWRRINSIRHQASLKDRIAQTEMMALRSQMNPHFIFNCLNSIDNLIQTNNKEKATSYLARFAKLIRAILENSKHESIPVWKDIETLKLYLELELLRFDHKFKYSIQLSDELLQGDYKMPPLILQPYVENAIHHGLLNKKEANRVLSITGTAVNGNIVFTITDNGVGRQQATSFKNQNKPAHQSLGLNITKERIDLHNEQQVVESVGIVDLTSNGQPAGTMVKIILKNK